MYVQIDENKLALIIQISTFYPEICFIVRQKLNNRCLICDNNHKSDGQIFEIQRRSSLGMKHSVESACSF